MDQLEIKVLEKENELLREQVAQLQEELDEKSRRYRLEVDRLSRENDHLLVELNRIRRAIAKVSNPTEPKNA